MTDLTRALSEIKRRAVYLSNPKGGGPVHIEIAEAELMSALTEVFGDDSVLGPEPSQHTP